MCKIKDTVTAIKLCRILLMLNRVRLRKMEEQPGNYTLQEREKIRQKSRRAELFYQKQLRKIYQTEQ